MAKMSTDIETFDEFVARMGEVEKIEEFEVGRASSGHSRAVFDFSGSICYLESTGFRTVPAAFQHNATPAMRAHSILGPEPETRLWTSYETYGLERAQRMADHYKARAEETFYGPPQFNHFVFEGHDLDEGPENDFNRLMRLVHDKHTGKFVELWGPEPSGEAMSAMSAFVPTGTPEEEALT